MIINYRYNSLNQVVKQLTPDAGESNFWYDYLGRLVISQNAKQAKAATKKYSYTLYDYLGRITEVGEKETAAQVTQTITQDPSLVNNPLFAWLNGGTNRQITRTVYDLPYGGLSSIVQKNLRNRVSYTMVIPVQNTNTPPYSSATFYNYDIHGNVKLLYQDYGSSINVANRIKRIAYDYDLVSGKVNMVSYQAGYKDAFYHRYTYDAENRLTAVETSRDALDWFKDARYTYYRHGPLARSELGDLFVQGVDYAYTIQGWLKMINPSATNTTAGNCPVGSLPTKRIVFDPNDGLATGGSSTISFEGIEEVSFEEGYTSPDDRPIEGIVDNQGAVVCNTSPQAAETFDEDGTSRLKVGRDAYRVNLNYFEGDYQPVAAPALNTASGLLPAQRKDLYNGNISSMAVNIRKLAMQALKPGAQYAGPMLYKYGYDQLNRIVGMNALPINAAFSQLLTAVNPSDFQESYTYDANGNINTLQRNGSVEAKAPQAAMDNLAYQYFYNLPNSNVKTPFNPINIGSLPSNAIPTNQLAIVTDQVPGAAYSNDIDGTSNFEYDEIGNLVKDQQNDIQDISWTVYGKIEKIEKAETRISYTYDAAGNRISKILAPKIGASVGPGVTTWYMRDAQGNMMSTYEENSQAGTILQQEISLYGSSRLGILNVATDCSNLTLPANGYINTFERGKKFFEMPVAFAHSIKIINMP